MRACIRGVEYHLPQEVLTNAQLAALAPKWSADEIYTKTGIRERHIAARGECASDLAVEAGRKLFASGVCRPEEIDYLLLCTQSPDYFLPTTACLLQERLGLERTAGALDFNLGCSGFVYGLGIAKGLIETGQAHHVLLLTAETYSKYMQPEDANVRTVFGDGAAATLVGGAPEGPSPTPGALGPFIYGTDGRGARNLIVAAGGLRQPCDGSSAENATAQADWDAPRLWMDGPEIFTFTINEIPRAVQRLLEASRLQLDDVHLFVFHQANQFMLEHLRAKLKIPPQRFYVSLEHCGNTVSASIPIALKHAMQETRLRAGDTVALVGFGVGYSWCAALVQWSISS